jgi:hypothetical protein
VNGARDAELGVAAAAFAASLLDVELLLRPLRHGLAEAA